MIIINYDLRRPNSSIFLVKCGQKTYNGVCIEVSPEAMWDSWKNLFIDVVDKYATLKN